MKTNRVMMLMLALLGVVLVQNAQAFYNPSTGRWLSRDPIAENGFEISKADIPRDNYDSYLYVAMRNSPVINFDYLGLLAGTGNDGKSCNISPGQGGRVTFTGFSADTLASFSLIGEDGDILGNPDAGGSQSAPVDGFWWKGNRDEWFKIPGFCKATVNVEFSTRGFNVDWCCEGCGQLACEISTVFKDRPCSPGFVPNKGRTNSGTDYPW